MVEEDIDSYVDMDVERRLQEEIDALHEFHETEDLQWVLSDERGRRFIWRLLDEAGVYRQPFVGDRNHTDFNCGRKDYGLKVLDMILTRAPIVYAIMLKEMKNYERHINKLGRDDNGYPEN